VAMISIPQIVERLQKLSPEKLLVVYDFVSYLEERSSYRELKEPYAEAYQTMLASETVLGQDWDRPEEDLAWADL
jgi:hypothetical protein